jgi:2-polyprenyl-3-methyl-5-hydroxy-6-metoxy-1,4-benzoquinol methylase
VKLLSPDRLERTANFAEALGKCLFEEDTPAYIAQEPPKQHNGSIGGQGRTSSLRNLVRIRERELWETKLAHRAKPFWYPYATLRNIPVLERLLAGSGLDLLELCKGKYGRIADVGAADGDLGFFLEGLGFSVDVIDYEYTNFNRLNGARILKKALNSSITVRSIDLDSPGELTTDRYDAVFLLGVLYHLKNPFSLLERLARVTRYCFLSTRIARQTADGAPLSKYPVAYLLGAEECNNDCTNFWIFSDTGLKRLIDRAGWNILAYGALGDIGHSTPADPNHDERAFCVLESNAMIGLSAIPNPVPISEEIGKTVIKWNTPDARPCKVYVSTDGKKESLFAAGSDGVAIANWIQAGSTYEFRLYDSQETQLLDKIVVRAATL